MSDRGGMIDMKPRCTECNEAIPDRHWYVVIDNRGEKRAVCKRCGSEHPDWTIDHVVKR